MSRPRRLALAAVVVVAALLAVTLTAATTWSTRQAGPEALQRAEQLAAADASSAILQQAVRDCVVEPTAYGVVPGSRDGRSSASACTAAVAPRPAWYLTRPALSAGAVAEVDVLVLGLGLTVLAGVAGLLLGGATGVSGRRAAGAGGAVGLLATGALWLVVTVVLAQRSLPAPGPEAVAQTARAGALTALAAVTGHQLASRLGAVPGLLVAAVVGGASLLTPLDVLDLAGAWLLGRW